MRSSASLLFHVTFLHPGILHLHLPQKEGGSAQSSRGEEQNEFILSWAGGEGTCFLPCWWHEWLKLNIREHIRNQLTVVKESKKAWVEFIKFSTKVSNSLNSNQAQEACVSIWEVHQRTKRKEIWAGAGSGLKAFKWFLSVRKLFPLSVHAQENCFFGTWFTLNSGCSSFDQLKKLEVWKCLLFFTHTHTHVINIQAEIQYLLLWDSILPITPQFLPIYIICQTEIIPDKHFRGRIISSPLPPCRISKKSWGFSNSLAFTFSVGHFCHKSQGLQEETQKD